MQFVGYRVTRQKEKKVFSKNEEKSEKRFVIKKKKDEKMWHVLQTQKKLFHRKFIKYIFLFFCKNIEEKQRTFLL